MESAVCGDAAGHIVTVRKWHFTGQQFGTSERRNIYPVRRTALYVPRGLTFKKSTFCPRSVLCVLCGSQNKQRLFQLTGLHNREGVFTARYGLGV